jgi:hypothetical protein
MDWMYQLLELFTSNWNTVMLGGLVVVGVVMFLMGLLKPVVFDKITNKGVRKTVLSITSLILVFPATIVWIISKGWEWNWAVFWLLYTLNCIQTIVVYWLYEGTHIREALQLLGKKTIVKWISAIAMGRELTSVSESVDKYAEDTLKQNSKYKDEDLKNL